MYCKILKVNPSVSKKLAAELSVYITRYAKKFKFDPALSVAIAMQESSLRNVNRMGHVLKDGKIVLGISDVGVFQIHVDTIASFNSAGEVLDAKRLETDLEYQTYWHARILSEKISTCKKARAKLQVGKGNEWSCYHSFTQSKRKVYLKDVTRHLVKLTQL